MAASKEQIVEIQPIKIDEVKITIVGDTPLITHSWGEKALREMLEKQMGTKQLKKKDPKNPVQDFCDSMYWLTDKPKEFTIEAIEKAIALGAKFGFPVTAIKQAALSGAYRIGATKNMVGSSGLFYVRGTNKDGREFAVIDGDPPSMREDVVKVGMGVADLRYRAIFENWKMDLTITYIANGPLSLEQIINMLNIGGYVVGIGEWRPERKGQNGMFHVQVG